MTDIDYYQFGKECYHAWMNSLQFAQFGKTATPRSVMKLFMPPPSQDLMQIQRPLPKEHQAWLQGFEEARQNESI